MTHDAWSEGPFAIADSVLNGDNGEARKLSVPPPKIDAEKDGEPPAENAVIAGTPGKSGAVQLNMKGIPIVHPCMQDCDTFWDAMSRFILQSSSLVHGFFAARDLAAAPTAVFIRSLRRCSFLVPLELHLSSFGFSMQSWSIASFPIDKHSITQLA